MRCSETTTTTTTTCGETVAGLMFERGKTQGKDLVTNSEKEERKD